MATILLVGVDLFFRGKLEGLLAGHHLITVDSVEPPDCVICDIARIEPEDVTDAYPDIPILGFANHTDTAGLRRAHTAGFDQVVVESGAGRACQGDRRGADRLRRRSRRRRQDARAQPVRPSEMTGRSISVHTNSSQ